MTRHRVTTNSSPMESTKLHREPTLLGRLLTGAVIGAVVAVAGLIVGGLL